MALPTRLNLEAWAGDNWSHTVQFVDENGTAINLNGAAWAGVVREAPDKTATQLAALSIDVSSQTSGILVLSIPDTTTVDMPKDGYYDLERTDTGETYLVGSFVTYRQIT